MKGEDVLKSLKNIKDPETGASILDLGIISGVKVEDEIITVYTNFNRAMPSCKACIPIAWMITNSIIRRIEKSLKNYGISYKIVESSTGQLHAEG
jgi:metal-sulfur cluster biosynthetic enzyme